MNFLSRKNITAAFFAGCFFFASCVNSESDVKKATAEKVLGTEEATDIKINYTTGGKAKAILTAPLMLHVQAPNSYYEFPKTLYAEFFNEQQQRESKLTALYGKYKDGESIIYLKDSVKIINMLRGDTIYCEDLWWDRNRTNIEFHTDKKVRIRQPDGQYLNGTGMEASQNFKNYVILHPFGQLNSKGDGMPGQ